MSNQHFAITTKRGRKWYSVSRIIEQLPDDMKRELNVAVQQGLDATLQDAEALVRAQSYRTGQLYRDLTTILYKESGRGFVYAEDDWHTRGDATKIKKRQAVEFGRKEWRPMEAKPFIRPAGAANYLRNRRRVTRAVKIVLDKLRKSV